MANTGYGGYFLKGLTGGIQAGINFKQQVQEMKWQKQQKKRLKERQDKMTEAANIWNAKIVEFGADKVFSDEELSQLDTLMLASGYEFMERYQGAMTYLRGMKDKEFNEQLEWMDLFIDMTSGLSPDSIPEIYDDFEKRFTSEKAKLYFKANKVMQEKKIKAAEEARDLTIGRMLPSEYVYSHLKEKGLVGEITPTITPEKLSALKEKIAGIDRLPLTEKRKNELKIKIYAGGDSSIAEKVRAIYAAGGTNEDVVRALSGEAKVTGVTAPKPETVTTLKNWEKMFDIKAEEGPKTEEEYNRALNLLAQSEDKYKPQYATWKEALMSEAKGIAKELKGITDKEDFNLLLGIYMQKLEEIKAKYPEVDLNQFPEFEEQKSWFDRLKEKVGL